MTPAILWWWLDSKRPQKTWGKKYQYTEAQMRQMYDEMTKQHEAIYGRSN